MSRTNNLSFLRLIAALMVLYSHCFAIKGLPEPVYFGLTTAGGLAVYIFFTLSGYLIAESWDREPDIGRFLLKRSLRVFPGLAVCILLSSLVAGPLLTTFSLHDYFTSPQLLTYLENIFLYISFELPGVFSGNSIPNVVNGSLWSLPIEFFMYIIVAMIGQIFSASRWIYLLALITGMITCISYAFLHPPPIAIYGVNLAHAIIASTYFLTGACCYKFDINRYLSINTLSIAIALWLLLTPFPEVLLPCTWILLPAVVFSYGFSSQGWIERITAQRDYSYGIYIYAFPVQQAIIQHMQAIKILPFIVLSAGITILFAAISWHCIERPSLAIKHGFRRYNATSTSAEKRK